MHLIAISRLREAATKFTDVTTQIEDWNEIIETATWQNLIEVQQTDLIPVFGSSDLAAEIIAGKRSIDRTHAEKLSDRFNLPAKLFLV